MTNSVYDLAINKDHLFVPDYRNNKLIIFGLPSGKILSTFDVPMPHGIAVDQNGTIYVCTYKKNSIFILEKNVKACNKNTLFDYPVSIAIKDDYTFIANWGNGSVGNVIFSNDNLDSFDQFTEEWLESKPHAVRINNQHKIMVVYRNSPGLVVYDINGNIIRQKIFSDEFDPVSIIAYKDVYLVPNANDGQIYLFDNLLNDLGSFYGGDYLPTNLAIWDNLLFICEEKANRILSINLENFDNILN